MDLSLVFFPCFVLDVVSNSCEDLVTPERLSGLIFNSLYACFQLVESNLFNHSYTIEVHKVNNVDELKFVLKSVLGASYEDFVGVSVDEGSLE